MVSIQLGNATEYGERWEHCTQVISNQIKFHWKSSTNRKFDKGIQEKENGKQEFGIWLLLNLIAQMFGKKLKPVHFRLLLLI